MRRRREFGFAGWVAALAAAFTLLLGWVYDLPVRDPDSSEAYLVPTYVRLPLILLLAFALDVVPRALWRSRHGLRASAGEVRRVVRERWGRREVRFALVGLLTWYVAYASYRNVKSFVPFVNAHLWDAWLRDLDRMLFLGHDPYRLLHELLGRDVAAHVLSFVYLAWVVVVPFTLVVTLMWSRNRPVGEWYVTAVALDWVLGALTYLALPALGPVYADPEAFDGLAPTGVTRLQTAMMRDRQQVLDGPFAADGVQMIAAFVSLHVTICVTICVFVELRRMHALVRASAWAFLLVTVVSTVYLGWHYTLDLVGGAALGVAAAWIAARATGQPFRRVSRGATDGEVSTGSADGVGSADEVSTGSTTEVATGSAAGARGLTGR
jgi:hypothetical protein